MNRQQLNRFVEDVKWKVEAYSSRISNPDIGYALLHMLEQHKDDLPEISKEYDSFFFFVKTFRQTDVTGNGHYDMVMWNLLNGCRIADLTYTKMLKNPDEYDDWD